MRYKGLKNLFDRVGLWIVRHFPFLLCGKQAKKIEKQLCTLRVIRKESSLERYYGRKISKMLWLCFFGGIFLLLTAVLIPGKVIWMEAAVIKRPEKGEGDLETEFSARVEGEAPVLVPVLIQERMYTKEEKEEIFKEVFENLEETVLGKNESFDRIQTDLNLPAEFLDGKVSAEWEIEPWNYLDYEGHFVEEPPQNGIEVMMRVKLCLEEEERIREFPMKLLPPEKTKEEKKIAWLSALAQKAADTDLTQREVTLPQTAEESAVFWGTRQKSPLPFGVLLLTAGLLYLYMQEDQKLEKEEKQRKRQLVMDYPMILYKMSMLIGAGMTIRGAFTKIAYHYREQRGKEIRYAYEEMLLACYEMQKGIGEGTAYENFGQRCCDLRYLKFATMLSQNLKKGSEGLSKMLQEEAQSGMEERKNLARKLGEEAGTRLLFPMTLMLGLVMAILMIPAMISF